MKLKNIFDKEINIEIGDSEDEASFITHSGTFHADEVMATVILLNKFDDIKLFRTNNPSNKDAFTYDVGFGKYDHHDINFDKTRPNGVKYASCGLIWNEFGKEILSKLNIRDIDSLFDNIDRNIIMDIDRDDNGQLIGTEPIIKIQGIPNIVSYFNPAWNDTRSETECFLNVISIINTIFNNYVNKLISKEEARDIVEERIKESNNKILILDRYMPWKDIVLSSNNPIAKDILYAVFPSKRGGYNIVATPKESGSFEVKKPFPLLWAGKENEELQKISGVKTITFCHKNLFICACETYDDAIKIANIAVSNSM